MGHGTTESVPKHWKWPEIPTQKEMDAMNVAFRYRDRCVGLYMPYLQCLRNNYFLGFKCAEQHHVYEECLYYDFLERKAAFEKQIKETQAKKGAMDGTSTTQ